MKRRKRSFARVPAGGLPPAAERLARTMTKLAAKRLKESARLKVAVAASHRTQFARCAGLVIDAIRRGHTLFFFGNGGSAADAQHLACEFVGRFLRERRALPAVALTTDTSAMTSISNDYGFTHVYARQIEGLVRRGDVVFALSTSGRSPSVVSGIRAAKARGAAVVGLTVAKGRAMAAMCDVAFVVPSAATPRIQEVHITIGHVICELADAAV